MNKDEEIAEIKARSERAKQTDVVELINTLERERNGANVHTVNKAIFYLNYFTNNEEARYLYKFDRLQDLKYAIVLALETKDYTKLSRHMNGWF